METIYNSKHQLISFIYNQNNIHIFDSYLVDKEDIDEYLARIRNHIYIKSGFVYKRSINSWKYEWIVHNILYKFRIEKERTDSVDLNEDESLIKRFIYFILGVIFYV